MGKTGLAVAMAAAGVAFSALPATPAAADAHRGPGHRPLATASRATAPYHRLAAAETDGDSRPGEEVGSGLLHGCVSHPDFPAVDAAMGFHWINFGLLDATLDPAEPEVLVYEPTASGRLRLVALEYVVFRSDWEGQHGVDSAPPRLFGRPLSLVDEPNRYGLPAFYQVHVWLWKHNPDGLFSNDNPRVSCAHAVAVDGVFAS